MQQSRDSETVVTRRNQSRKPPFLKAAGCGIYAHNRQLLRGREYTRRSCCAQSQRSINPFYGAFPDHAMRAVDSFDSAADSCVSTLGSLAAKLHSKTIRAADPRLGSHEGMRGPWTLSALPRLVSTTLALAGIFYDAPRLLQATPVLFHLQRHSDHRANPTAWMSKRTSQRQRARSPLRKTRQSCARVGCAAEQTFG